MIVKTELKKKTMDDMMKRLRKLGTKKALRAPAAAVRAGSSVIIKATRPSVPVDTGTLKKAIGQKVKSKRVYATSIFGVRNRKVTTGSGKIKNAVRSSSFSKLKEKEEQEGFSEAPKSKAGDKKIPFFNLGPKNNWKKILDQDLKEKLNNIFKKKLEELSYK